MDMSGDRSTGPSGSRGRWIESLVDGIGLIRDENVQYARQELETWTAPKASCVALSDRYSARITVVRAVLIVTAMKASTATVAWGFASCIAPGEPEVQCPAACLRGAALQSAERVTVHDARRLRARVLPELRRRPEVCGLRRAGDRIQLPIGVRVGIGKSDTSNSSPADRHRTTADGVRVPRIGAATAAHAFKDLVRISSMFAHPRQLREGALKLRIFVSMLILAALSCGAGTTERDGGLDGSGGLDAGRSDSLAARDSGAGRDDAAGNAGKDGGSDGMDGAAACFSIFHSCELDTECCAPNRCLNITGINACQLEGPQMIDGSAPP